MSETENQKATPEAPEKQEKKKGGKKILIVALLILLLAGGGGAGFYFWRASSTAKAAEKEKKKTSKKSTSEDEETASDHEDNGEKGKMDDSLKTSIPNDEDVSAVVELPPFIVNLADTEQARYLRMTVSLGVEGAEGESEKPDQLFITRVRNTMLAVLAEKKSDDVLSAEGKAKLRKELLKAAQAASEEPKVKAIYITDFIVQL